MAISRPFLLALLGVVLLGATVLAVQNARDASDSDATPAAVQSDAAPAPAQTPANTAPAETLRSAFEPRRARERALRRRGSSVGDRRARCGRLARRLRARRRKGRSRTSTSTDRASPPEGAAGGFVVARRQGLLHPRRHRLARARRAVDPVAVAPARRPAAPGFGFNPATLGARRQVRGHRDHRRRRDRARLRQHRPAGRRQRPQRGRQPRAAARPPDAEPRPGASSTAELDAWVGTDDHILRRACRRELDARATARTVGFDVRLQRRQRAAADRGAGARARAGAPDGASAALAQGARRRHRPQLGRGEQPRSRR